MTATTHALSDSATMLRRDLKHLIRYPSVTVMLIGMPVVFLLLFVYVLGGTLGHGLDGGGGRADYLAYVVPGILVITVCAVAQGTAISVAMDMTEGIIARFRTMAISRAAVLTGHVGGSMIQTALGLLAVTLVALVMGYRAPASAVQWLAVAAVLAMIAFALTWLTVALGLASSSVEAASNTPMFLILLPFLSSGFAPTDSMPPAVRWFAAHQPFTPFIDTVRGLLAGAPVGTSALATTIWCAAIAGGSYLWARSSYERRSLR
ncbi:ABC transporter permease [Aquihabitans sp. McL0605]|uniref:ABC transporter permease n=1 Tax=Aquihabitans sp. McL0605 TaxID=3415671 RepID=UPI003CEDE690